MAMNLEEKTHLVFLVPLRLWIGYYLLQQGINKYLRDFPHRDWVERQIGNVAELNLYPWYKAFLQQVVVPNQELFGYLVVAGEVLLGGCLVLGLFTRFSALVGLFMLINFLLGPGMARGGSALAQQQTFIVSLVVIVLTNPGRTFGLDGLWSRRR
jgi:uncharacterized membrane protein YphA (DoxX/SURF4 family)